MTLDEIAAVVPLRHYCCYDDPWFCCGACDFKECPEDSGLHCLDESRRGRCDCGLDERKRDVARAVARVIADAADEWNGDFHADDYFAALHAFAADLRDIADHSDIEPTDSTP